MKKYLSAAIVACVIAGGAVSGWANPSGSAKGIIRSGQAQGVAMEVVDAHSGRMMPPTTQFRNGQPFRLRFQTSMPGHLYLINVSPSGKRTQIFPQQTENNHYPAGTVEIPSPDRPPFQFDNESGVEMIEVAISPNTISAYEQARFNPGLADTTPVRLGASSGPPRGGFSHSNAAKGIFRPDGITFPDPIGPDEYFTFTASLVHR